MGDSNDKELGYITRAIEDLVKRIDDHMADEKEDRVKLEKSLEAVNKRLDLLENQALVRKGMMKLLGFAGSAIILFLTFKFGDIKILWHLMFQK